MEIQKASFIGKGIGVGSLDSFRRVTTDQKDYFEKVYFNSHEDLERIKWFQEHIYALIQHEIKVPRIQKIYSGDLLTIVYFEYFNLNDLKEERKKKAIIEFSKDLYRISYTNEATLSRLEIPTNLKDFRKHFEYQSNINLARRKLGEYGIVCHSFEQEAASSKHIITHADIQETNVFKDSVLIDWDTFGIYPIGLEPAFIYFRLLMKDSNRSTDVIDWLNKYYSEVISERDWKDFKRNFVFFLFVFSAKRIYRGIFNHIEQPLIKKLKQFNRTAFIC
jgi:hypothetical protein